MDSIFVSSIFANRSHAGQVLAGHLRHYADRDDVVVLGLPRGGIPVACEVARELHAPLDVFIVRKLGVPGHEELAMGAIASGGLRVLNRDIIQRLGISQETIEAVTAREQREVERREALYRGSRPPLAVEGKTVVLIDDGLATGATMRAAVEALRQQEPARIVVAVPTASAETCEAFASIADEVVCATTPEPFYGVGVWYEDFSQTSDQEVRAILERAWRSQPLGAASH